MPSRRVSDDGRRGTAVIHIDQDAFIRVQGSNSPGFRTSIKWDTGSPRSFILEETFNDLARQDEAFRTGLYDVRRHPKWNDRYQRCLHKIKTASQEATWIETTKWKSCHAALVKHFGFLPTTHKDLHLVETLTGTRIYFIGRIDVEYKCVNNPTETWTPKELPVVRLPVPRDANIIMGRDTMHHEACFLGRIQLNV